MNFEPITGHKYCQGATLITIENQQYVRCLHKFNTMHHILQHLGFLEFNFSLMLNYISIACGFTLSYFDKTESTLYEDVRTKETTFLGN